MKRVAWIDAVAVFGLSLAYVRLLPDCFSLFDEGIVASTAQRLYGGETLYRDVFSHWTPGTFWLTGGMYRVFGVSVVALRLPLALMGATAAVLVWRLARYHAGRALALLAGLAVPLVCYPVWWMASPHWYSTLVALAATLALQCGLAEDATPWWLAAAGGLCGVTFLFLQPVGLWLTLFATAAVAWIAVWTTSVRTACRCVGLLLAAASLPVAATYAAFAAHGAAHEMIYDTVWWNLQHYHSAFQIAYGAIPFGLPKDVALRSVRWVVTVLPPVVYAAALLLSARPARALQRTDGQLLGLAATGAGVLAGNYYYPDLVHLAAAAPPAFATLAALLHRLSVQSWGRRSAQAIAFVFGCIAAFAGVAGVQRTRAECSVSLSTPRGTIAASPSVAEDLQAVLTYVEHLPVDERLFVYPYAPGYYFLTGRRNPTRYEYLFPYLSGAHSALQLAEIVTALDHQHTRYVLLSLLWGESMLARYDTTLERYIRVHYHILQRFPGTVLLERDAPGRDGPKVSLDQY